jgi:hypothetical protein
MRFAAQIEEILHARTRQRRDHEGLLEPASPRVERLGQRQQLLALDEVDLVEHQDLGVGHLFEALQQGLDFIGVTPRSASTISATRSASPAPVQAASTMARSSRRLGAKMPGVSMKTICASPSVTTPRIWARVVCALCVTIDTFAPTSELSRVDLPALGAPTRAMKPQRVFSGVAGVSSWRVAPDFLSDQEFLGGLVFGQLLGGAGGDGFGEAAQAGRRW